MRFLLKTAFWLALIAFFLPAPAPENADRQGVNYFGAFLGAQEALSDMSGFCERSPAACEAGRDIGSFVAARVADGAAYAYSLVQGHDAAPVPAEAVAARPVPANTLGQPAAPGREARPSTDPMKTAAVGAEHVRRTAGLPPFGLPEARGELPAKPASNVPGGLESAALPAIAVVPTPAPRS